MDLFCGIGGLRIATERAAENLGLSAHCVFASDVDPDCQRVYQVNFGTRPQGDLRAVRPESIPDHDLVLAGFPCQPFSIAGQRKGFEDERGAPILALIKILQIKQSPVVVLENVKHLATHQNGKTLALLCRLLRQTGYYVDGRILNALDFGLPQRRERLFIVATRHRASLHWPERSQTGRTLRQLLETEVPQSF